MSNYFVLLLLEKNRAHENDLPIFSILNNLPPGYETELDVDTVISPNVGNESGAVIENVILDITNKGEASSSQFNGG